MIKRILSTMLVTAMLGGCTTDAFVGESESPYFNKFYGNANDDQSYRVSQLADGGYLIVGSTEKLSGGDSDILVIKSDSRGNLVWEQVIGGSFTDFGTDGVIAADGNLYVTGLITNNETEDENGALISLNPTTGEVIDSASFGLPNRMERGLRIFNSNSGSLMVMLNRDDDEGSEMVISELDLVAQDTLYRDYGFLNNQDSVNMVLQSTNDNLVWSGTVRGENSFTKNIRVTSTNLDGQVLWDYLMPYENQEAADMDDAGIGYIVVGTRDEGINSNIILAMVNRDGNGLLWESEIEESGGQKASAVSKTSDGGFIVTGTTNYETDDEQIILIKTDSKGNVQWKKYFGGSSNDRGADVLQSSDGNYVLLSTSTISNNSILELIKTSDKGLLVD
ncbi:hypothetical protein OO013_02280 [Mangrovivirga sp. M17]|uniref:Uncharacterized protein n=1 Tax=Mangrovivirga halotolerans TaxID=2993936 RepID=A0ABT3RN39_9BACT|nr:hypothetical protein [Mangrovivirga halotolerans]MCX2742672.1 hypothetical protein [Mangrovivirga halotolerans]